MESCSAHASYVAAPLEAVSEEPELRHVHGARTISSATDVSSIPSSVASTWLKYSARRIIAAPDAAASVVRPVRTNSNHACSCEISPRSTSSYWPLLSKALSAIQEMYVGQPIGPRQFCLQEPMPIFFVVVEQELVLEIGSAERDNAVGVRLKGEFQVEILE